MSPLILTKNWLIWLFLVLGLLLRNFFHSSTNGVFLHSWVPGWISYWETQGSSCKKNGLHYSLHSELWTGCLAMPTLTTNAVLNINHCWVYPDGQQWEHHIGFRICTHMLTHMQGRGSWVSRTPSEEGVVSIAPPSQPLYSWCGPVGKGRIEFVCHLIQTVSANDYLEDFKETCCFTKTGKDSESYTLSGVCACWSL